MVNIQDLIDDAMCYETIRAMRWSEGLACPHCSSASVICRLEDADYHGHSLSMLRRVAAAVGKRVEVRFVSPGKPAAPRKATGKRRVKSSGG